MNVEPPDDTYSIGIESTRIKAVFYHIKALKSVYALIYVDIVLIMNIEPPDGMCSISIESMDRNALFVLK